MQFPFAEKLFDIEFAAEEGIASLRASFNRAHASSAEPNVDAETERAARASLYAFAEERRSEYAVCEASRSAFVRTAYGERGGGGRGRLKELGIGLAVLAYE